MRNRDIFLFILLLNLFVVGCKKSSDDSSNTSIDLAAKSSGTYTGTYTYGPGIVDQGSMQISKLSETTVKVIEIVNGGSPVDYYPVNVSDGGNNKIFIKMGSYLDGTVDGKTFNCEIDNGAAHFIGTKQ